MSTVPSLTLRTASFDDAAALADLGRRTFLDTFADDNEAADMEAYLAQAFALQQIERELHISHATFFLAEADTIPVGYAKLDAEPSPACVTTPRPAHLSRLYVDHAWLGHGVGKALMRQCIAAATSQGFQSIWLGVWEHNMRALAFYKKWGFTAVGTMTFVLGTDVQTDLVMSAPL